ncbi:MAG: hypothetical protein K2Y35_02170 [Burkholderiales bacterium]|nr:hypothetical protein [Burkholderiales bacterium]
MAKPLTITKIGDKLDIEGYPNAVAVKRIDDPIARQLQGIALHHFDLSYCRAALAELTHLDRSIQPLLAEALWVSTIARYFKCFGRNKSRTQLSPEKILKNHPGAEEVFGYFRDLRDKHIIHDENPYSQAFTGIALNVKDAEYKIADVFSLAMNAFTVDDDHLRSFTQLTAVTLAWVDAKRDELHNLLGKQYEQWEYEVLLALPDIAFTVPTSDKVDSKR